jgi:hypothetical protein
MSAIVAAAVPMEVMVAPMAIIVAIAPAVPMIAIAENKVAVYVQARSPDAVKIPVAAPWNGHIVIAVPRAWAIEIVIAGPARSPDPDRQIDAGGTCRLGCDNAPAQHQRGGTNLGKRFHPAAP